MILALILAPQTPPPHDYNATIPTPMPMTERRTPARPKPPKRGLGARLAGFSSNRRGATAVEFALIITPFLFILFAIIEISVIFLVTLTLEDATAQAARSLRTGATAPATGRTGNAASITSFQNTICNNMAWLQTQCLAGVTAGNGLVIDVRNPSSFSNGSTTMQAINGGTLSQTAQCFYSGQVGGDIVVVRAFYPWTLFIPGLNLAFPKLGNGQIVVSDAEVFKLEPNGNTTEPTGAAAASGSQGC